MAEIKPFSQVKLICGIIANQEGVFEKSQEHLIHLFGSVDASSERFPFDFTDYYKKQMGPRLKRTFLSFTQLISPEKISEIKIQTNGLEEKIKSEFRAKRRVVNLDPGYLTSSALIMATAKDYSHRIPLQHGIYAHLELMFKKNHVETLSWTYPDFKTEEYQRFFWKVRKIYLASK
ncbi:DUF4416 family protein [bacterium]|nr:DUF4416 family protein [bacterium]